MSILRFAIQYLFAPLFFIGFIGSSLWLMSLAIDKIWLLGLLIPAIATSFVAERILPFEDIWNKPKSDVGRDWIHALVNETTIFLMVAAIPYLLLLPIGFNVWPKNLDLWLQLLIAILMADFGITMAHYFSHKIEGLWRFHAIHHSVERMYGFNGLMKHPLHQGFELLIGTTPLILMGMPMEVGALLGFSVAIQLMLQHSNVDMKVGPLIYIWAVAPGHRHHHLASKTKGDVNFGLFTMFWDHLLGTFVNQHPSPRAGELGVAGRDDFPNNYLGQLIEPFRNLKRINK